MSTNIVIFFEVSSFKMGIFLSLAAFHLQRCMQKKITRVIDCNWWLSPSIAPYFCDREVQIMFFILTWYYKKEHISSGVGGCNPQNCLHHETLMIIVCMPHRVTLPANSWVPKFQIRPSQLNFISMSLVTRSHWFHSGREKKQYSTLLAADLVLLSLILFLVWIGCASQVSLYTTSGIQCIMCTSCL